MSVVILFAFASLALLVSKQASEEAGKQQAIDKRVQSLNEPEEWSCPFRQSCALHFSLLLMRGSDRRSMGREQQGTRKERREGDTLRPSSSAEQV